MFYCLIPGYLSICTAHCIFSHLGSKKYLPNFKLGIVIVFCKGSMPLRSLEGISRLNSLESRVKAGAFINCLHQ